MSKASAIHAIYNDLNKKIVLGNSKRNFKHMASDLLHATGQKVSTIADGTFLSATTVARVMECEELYRPQSETLERIFRYCNAQVSFDLVKIRSNYANKPK